MIFPAFFEPVSTALLLQETAVIALIWVMIQLKAFLTPLLAIVLQLKEQFNQCLPSSGLCNQILDLANRKLSCLTM